MSRKKCRACGKAPAMRLREVCGICELIETCTPPGGHAASGWPLVSRAAAVHPDEIPEAVERDRKAGVPTEYDARGNVIFRDRGHRKRYLRAHGMRDNDAGYGD